MIALPNPNVQNGASKDIVTKIKAYIPYNSAPSDFVNIGSKIRLVRVDIILTILASPTFLAYFL